MKKLYLNLSLLQLIILIFLPSKLKSQNYWASDLSQIKEIDNTPVKIFDLNDVKFKNEFKNQKQKVVFLPNENNDYESFIIKEILL